MCVCLCVCVVFPSLTLAVCSAIWHWLCVVLCSYRYLWPDPSVLCYIIPFWHLLSNFNEMTQANKLSLNFPSLCPLVSSFINWTANVVLIFSFLQLNLKWPRLLVVYGPELLFLDISIHSMTPFLFFFLSCGDEWTRHTVSRHTWSWQWRHSLQVSSQFCLNFLSTFAKCGYPSSLWQTFLNDYQCLDFISISTFDSKILQGIYFLRYCLEKCIYIAFLIFLSLHLSWVSS